MVAAPPASTTLPSGSVAALGDTEPNTVGATAAHEPVGVSAAASARRRAMPLSRQSPLPRRPYEQSFEPVPNQLPDLRAALLSEVARHGETCSAPARLCTGPGRRRSRQLAREVVLTRSASRIEVQPMRMCALRPDARIEMEARRSRGAAPRPQATASPRARARAGAATPGGREVINVEESAPTRGCVQPGNRRPRPRSARRPRTPRPADTRRDAGAHRPAGPHRPHRRNADAARASPQTRARSLVGRICADHAPSEARCATRSFAGCSDATRRRSERRRRARRRRSSGPGAAREDEPSQSPAARRGRRRA